MTDVKILRDSQAEALENKGFYRRAAKRWLDVMLQSRSEDGWHSARRRREACLRRVKRPPVPVDNFSDIRRAVSVTQRQMGIDQPGGMSFRRYKS